jgi:hypothetical protein
MSEHWCECDPHGDGRCDRPCAKPRHVSAAEAAAIVEKARRMNERPKPSPEDMAEAIETLRMLASRVRGTAVAQSLTRVATWIEGER